jgi:hypothetical protein
MPADNNVNIKLEVFKEKFSGKLSIIAHFIHSAPNVYKEQEDYVWFPTSEEKYFLIEAFELTSPVFTKNYQDNKHISQVSIQDVKPDVVSHPPSVVEPNLNVQGTEPQYANKDPVVVDEHKTNNKVNSENKQEPTQTNTKYYDEVTKEENNSNQSYFQSSKKNKREPAIIDFSKDAKTYESKKDVQVPDTYYNQNQEENKKDPQYTQSNNDEADINNAVIAQADFEAIDAALKKHTEKENYMVQADEKAIVDKVINQKKKGKWARRE